MLWLRAFINDVTPVRGWGGQCICDTMYKGLNKTVILVWQGGKGVSEKSLIWVTSFMNSPLLLSTVIECFLAISTINNSKKLLARVTSNRYLLCKNTPKSCNIGQKSLKIFLASFVTALSHEDFLTLLPEMKWSPKAVS